MFGRGPFRASQLLPKSDYELVNGHPASCSPAGCDGAGAILNGGSVIRSDPKVKRACVGQGFSPDDVTVLAPDIAIIPEGGPPGRIPGVPGFAVEYAGTGQDEASLQEKIHELLARGTRLIWVVRLVGPRRVEVYTPDGEVTLVVTGEMLTAPEFIANAIPVEALWDPEAADRATLHNLLGRFGYRDVEAIREEGREEGREKGREEGRESGELATLRLAVETVLRSRSLPLTEAECARIAAETDRSRLRRWLSGASAATTLDEALSG